MPRWSKRLIMVMFRRKLLQSPSQLLGLLLSLILILALWSNSFRDGRRRKSLVDFIKQPNSVAYFRPVKREKTTDEESKGSEKNDCPIYRFKSNDLLMTPDNGTNPVVCKRHLPVPGSCDVAKELFDLHGPPNPMDCSFQDRIDFCHLQYTDLKVWTVVCDVNATKVCTSGLQLGLTSHETGELIWETYETVNLLADTLTNLIQQHRSSHNPPHYGFAFISCTRKRPLSNPMNENASYYYYNYQESEDSVLEQFLILPPIIEGPPKSDNHIPSSFHDLNINVILVDSVSHQHMFRSLPETISVLQKIGASTDVDVFNFELFQAIKSRTFETLQTLMSGYVNVTETPFGRYDIPSKPLNLMPIYRLLQNRGYRTLWLEDLCYLWEWGISKDLRFLQLDSSPEDTWKRMWSALTKNGVDDIGATIGMCRLLKANGVQDHFHGPDAVCFNGRHQHEYIFEYLQLYQQEMTRKGRPFFTMTSTNVAHEATGKRVQTLDAALASYISFTSSLTNTVTIIFSDHGNSYGKYFELSKEAMIELYHPFMFFIIPKSAANLLGKDLIGNLTLNTKRLITSLDIHYTLLHVADINSKGRSKVPGQKFSVSEKGLFDPVSPDRDCYSVPRLKPSICICQTKSVHHKSSSFGSLFGYLALGALNDEIQFSYRQSINSSTSITAFGNCEPLYLEDVTDIKEIAGPEDQKVFQMNIHVQQSQIFFVSISLKRDEEGHPSAVLESYTRVTAYGKYSNCSDKAVELALCICNVSVSGDFSVSQQNFHHSVHTNQKFIQKLSSLTVLPFFNHSVSPFQHMPCFYIFVVVHKDGEAIFGVNECATVYMLTMRVKKKSKFLYFEKKEDTIVLPGGISLMGLVVSEYGELWKHSFQTDFTLAKN